MKNKEKVYPERSRRVFVGLSGGVDSAVSAALLKKATPNNFSKLFGRPTPKGFRGYDVTGVFIKAWTPSFDSAQDTRRYPCEWKEDRRSAMKVAAVLDIPFITLDLEKEYKKEVVDYMIAEYKMGRTPNPDVMCNKEIKFGHFLKFALDNGADFVATGHYAQKVASSQQPVAISQTKSSKTLMLDASYLLLEGTDPNKDQSYFLWTLTQNQLKHILFPIGHLQKSDVRKLADKFGLPQAKRKDSQGVCFLGQIDMKDFLKEYVGTKEGKVLNEKGEIVGKHGGAVLYTIGERHGFIVTRKTDKETPLYLVAKNIEKNTITVAPQTQIKITPHLKMSKTAFDTLSWVSGKMPDLSKKYLARVRYRQEKQKCQIEKDGKNLRIIFDQPQTGISPGQSLVLYDKETCLGGGIIQ